MHFNPQQLPVIFRYNKGHPEVMVLQGVLLCGTLMGALYGLRVAMKEPEVTWRHHGNDQPWNEYADKQYKFFSAGRDYSLGSPAPKFD